MPPAIATNLHHTIGGNNLNINLPDNNAVLRLEVELRDKNARRRPNNRHKGFAGDGRKRPASPVSGAVHQTPPNPNNFFIPMEKVSISPYCFTPFFVSFSLYSNLKPQLVFIFLIFFTPKIRFTTHFYLETVELKENSVINCCGTQTSHTTSKHNLVLGHLMATNGNDTHTRQRRWLK